MAEGECKLTKETGKFIKSHLIPKSLTQPAEKGEPFIQSGRGERPTKRWDSWYDKKLVIQKGEDILTALDTWAITELRNKRLVWSGWGPMNVLQADDYAELPGTPFGVHRVQGMDPDRLRLFFLSLLWRAAATDRYEFNEVEMPSEDLEQLRLMLLNSNPEPKNFYPITLTQLSTLGMIQNQSPIAMTKENPPFGEIPARRIPIFRFYFDGLIAHVHRHRSDNGETEATGNFFVGYGDELLVTTVTYEESFQDKNIKEMMAETREKWPHVLDKL